MFTKKIEEMTTSEKPVKRAKVWNIIWCLLFFTGLILQVSAQDVSQKKLQILNYFQNAPNLSSNRIVSGEFVGAGREATLDPINIIQQQSGVWLGMIGMDYTNWGNPVNYVEPNRLAKQYWDLGGLVTISAHLQNPTNPSVGPRGRDQIRINEIFQAGTPTNNYWREELRQMADGLTELQNQGVVVLFRPYHEMNGNWFWWGGWENKEDFKRLWRETKSYMENERGLRNLIWVYAPNNSLNGGSDVLEYYAGSDQVDLVGLDIYLNEIDTEPQRVNGYQQLLTLGKPFGITEYGPFDPVNVDADKQAKGAFDFVRLMNSIRSNFPQTTFFQTWSGPWSISTNNNARTFLNDPWIANRGEIFQMNSGLTANYFRAVNLTNTAFSRTDATVNFTWGSQSPDPRLAADNFSVRWTGKIEVPASGNYKFVTASDDGVRLWVNGQLIINNWTDHGLAYNDGFISLEAGRKYDIKLEFYERGGQAQMQLFWQIPNTSQLEIIPSNSFSP
jgi:mannan endo-1,4-beta-mannosidase